MTTPMQGGLGGTEEVFDFLTVREAARLLGIGKNLAYQMVARGEIPSRRFGRKIVVPRTELARAFGASPHSNLPDAPPDVPSK